MGMLLSAVNQNYIKFFFPESQLVRMAYIIVSRKKVSHGAGDFQVIYLALVEGRMASISTVQIGLPVYQEVYDFCLLHDRWKVIMSEAKVRPSYNSSCGRILKVFLAV